MIFSVGAFTFSFSGLPPNADTGEYFGVKRCGLRIAEVLVGAVLNCSFEFRVMFFQYL